MLSFIIFSLQFDASQIFDLLIGRNQSKTDLKSIYTNSMQITTMWKIALMCAHTWLATPGQHVPDGDDIDRTLPQYYMIIFSILFQQTETAF
jgi:hypothetical protein